MPPKISKGEAARAAALAKRKATAPAAAAPSKPAPAPTLPGSHTNAEYVSNIDTSEPLLEQLKNDYPTKAELGACVTPVFSRFIRLSRLSKQDAAKYGLDEESVKFYSLIPKGERRDVLRRALLGKLMSPRTTEDGSDRISLLQDAMLDRSVVKEDEQVQLLVKLVTELPQTTLKKAAKQMNSASSSTDTQTAWAFLASLAKKLPGRASKLSQKAVKLIHTITDRTWTAVGKLARVAVGSDIFHAPTTLRDLCEPALSDAF